MAKQKKYYVVWRGKKPGIYDNWPDCKAVISGVKNARYKSFTQLEQAKKAFKRPSAHYLGKKKTLKLSMRQQARLDEVDYNSIAVDAASSGNPGRLEYRGVDTRTLKVLFHIGPFEHGTNNIGEFLAIVHGLAFLKHYQSDRIIYTDSRTAMAWVRRQQCNTKLQKNRKNAKLFRLINRAEKWLKKNDYDTPIHKWNTKRWGEVPADFGRK